jgi:hypothetical protein
MLFEQTQTNQINLTQAAAEAVRDLLALPVRDGAG